MRKLILLIILMLCIFNFNAQFMYGQSQGSQEIEKNYYERKVYLKENIEIGWTPEEVVDIMGEPASIKQSTQGDDEIEIWGYRGYDARIEFRNGFVEKWFFRFLP